MGRVVLYGLLVTASACGRYGFDSEDPAVLKCGVASKLATAMNPRELAAVATSTGISLLAVDDAKELRGWSYDWDDDQLTARTESVAIDIDVTGAFGVSAVRDELVVGAIHGEMTTLGTTYYALDASLAPRADSIPSAGRVIGVEPIARHGVTGALAGIRYEAGDVAVHGIATNGVELGTRMLGVAAEAPNELSIVSAETGYAVAWVDTAASPNVTRLALLDESYAIVYGPVSVMNGAGFDTIRPRIHWAPKSNTYAVTWFEKTPTNADDVYAQVFDAQLAPLFAAKLVQARAVRPKLATDGESFWIGYVNVAANPQRMDVARITPDGALVIRSAASSGGAPLAFAMVERANQPVLVSAENTGAVDLWFDPLCP